MPPNRAQRLRKPPPDGFDDIEPTLLEFGQKMKDAEAASHEGKTRSQSLWGIYQVTHARKFTPSIVREKV
jgi:bud site selection protein 31